MKLTKLLILFLFLSFKGISQQPQLFNFKYDKSEYCAGVNEIVQAKIYTIKGDLIPSAFTKPFKFTYTKISENGVLSLDSNGKLDLSNCSEGNYTIFLNDGFEGKLTKTASFNIVIKNCK